MIRLFASDLDGTLMNAFHRADATVLGAIREAVESGAHFAVATGRSMRSNGDFGFSGLGTEAVASNGSIIFDREGRIIRHVDIDPAFLEELLRTFPQVCFECVSPDGGFVTGSEEARQAGFKKDSPFRRIVMSGMRRRGGAMATDLVYNQTVSQILGHSICKLNARVPDAGLERELHAFLAEHADSVVNAPFNPVMFEITDARVNKGEAVAWLAAHLGFAQDEVAVYGDGGNDIAMLERFAPFGHAYATSNGSAAAKAAAHNVIGSCALYAVPRHVRRTIREQTAAPAYTRIE